MNIFRVLMLGDIVGRPGRHAIRDRLHGWREQYKIDLVHANGENASGGNGLTVKNAGELLEWGLDLITSGNHIWKQKDYQLLFEKYENVLRPANYPENLPGKGFGTVKIGDVSVGFLNLQGRVFMDPIDCPFVEADRQIAAHSDIGIILVDFHAEATSERIAMGRYLDGRVAAVMGTHTHVPSADCRILSGGTAYMTDLGMVGPIESVLGVDPDTIIKRFLTGLPERFEVAKGAVICSGAIISIDPALGKPVNIERFEERYLPTDPDFIGQNQGE
ncbi:MAG: TIGR00282 family metallophosphoesterase [bacterium]